MTVTASSYVRHRAGHCALIDHSKQNQPCWGAVVVVDEVSAGEEDDGGVCILACQGHLEKVKYGYRAKYRNEPSGATQDAADA